MDNDISSKYLDLEGLAIYDDVLKDYINNTIIISENDINDLCNKYFNEN